jgi:hypothetical protein
MRNKSIIRVAVVTVLMVSTLGLSAVLAHDGGRNVKLHVNPRWKECSFQIDPSLTQVAWHQFTQEAGLVMYFRPLVDAKSMGAGKFEFSILQWMTGIDDTDDAWNDTFVHPDSTHWLFEGDRLPIPGLMFRAGITNRIDVGVYFTKAVGANYGFGGGQVQYNFLNSNEKNWYASTRFSLISIFGPEDLGYTVYGLDLLASKEYAIFIDWLLVSPYAGVSTYLSSSHEKTAAVSLKDENIVGVQGMIGAVAQISSARLAVEYNFAKVSTLSFKLGIGF